MSFPPKFNVNENALKAVMVVAFVLSAALGTYILATDSYLWAEAPTHAFGLIAFVVMDVAVVFGVYGSRKVTRLVALLLPMVQLAAMAGDLYIGLGSPGSTVQQGFREYLLNDSAFMVLLILQAVTVGLAFGNLVQPAANSRFAEVAGDEMEGVR